MRSPGSKLPPPRLGLLPQLHSGDHLHPHHHPEDHLLRLPPDHPHLGHKLDHLQGNQSNLPDRRLNPRGPLPEGLLQLGVPQKLIDALIPVRLKPGFPTFHFSPSGINWVEMEVVPTIMTFPARPGPVLKFLNDWCPTNLQWKTTDLGLVYLPSQNLDLLPVLDNLKFKLLPNVPDNLKFKLIPNVPDNLKFKLLPNAPDNLRLLNNNDPVNKNLKLLLLQLSGTFHNFREHLHLKENNRYQTTNLLHKTTIPDLLKRGQDNNNHSSNRNVDLNPDLNHNLLPGQNRSKPFSATKITNNPSHWDHRLRPSITSLNHNSSSSSSSHNNRLGNNNRLFPNNNSSKTLHLLNNNNSNNNHNLDDPQDWDLKV